MWTDSGYTCAAQQAGGRGGEGDTKNKWGNGVHRSPGGPGKGEANEQNEIWCLSSPRKVAFIVVVVL